ncbi:hypothetical protein B0H11DRAFT_2263267 [Mycena galericulata]|nr:hypothetical protein B0H11DRAFT_2263267 [Mycena galericulata]
MDLPQELIDGIIDEVREYPECLRSCALVAHSFLNRSQMHLFAKVELREDTGASPRGLSDLLLTSPHLALHIRSLTLERISTDNWAPVAYILSAVSCRLTCLKLHAAWETEGNMYLKTQAPFKRLESFLSSSPKLESLRLENIVFSHSNSIITSATPPHDVRVAPTVVSKLTLRQMKRETIDLIMSSFTAVDLKHLHSLSLDDAAFLNTLQPNPTPIRDLELFFGTGHLDGPQKIEWHSPALADLESLHLEGLIYSFLLFLHTSFEDLGHLKKLRRLTVCLGSSTNRDEQTVWNTMDAYLRVFVGIGTVKSVHISTPCIDLSAAKRLRSWMPSLDAGGVLSIRVFHTSQLEPQLGPQLEPQLGDQVGAEIKLGSKLDVKSCLTPRLDIQLGSQLGAPTWCPNFA